MIPFAKPAAVAALMGLALPAAPAAGLDAALQLVLTLEGNAQREIVIYRCEGIEEPLEVHYLNAHPNFLAIVPIEGETLVFANVIAASGARYVAGPYEWWSRGAEAQFSDMTRGEDAEPVPCLSDTDIP